MLNREEPSSFGITGLQDPAFPECGHTLPQAFLSTELLPLPVLGCTSLLA